MLFTSETYATIGAASNRILMLPLGATEQHGPHLGVGTDADIVTSLATAAELHRQEKIILAPTLPYGSSHHHLPFGGTMSLSADLYVQVVIDLVRSLLHCGFRRIVLLNGHGGNITPVKQALSLLSKEFDNEIPCYIALATYWELAGSAFSGDKPMESPALSHACEYETSLMLHLYPEKVRMDKVKRAVRPAKNGYVAFEDDIPYRGVSIVKQTAFISDNGCSGEPQLATKEKGDHLYQKALAAILSFVDDFATWPILENLKNK
ncbi:creatininase family protein [Flavihumibacter profundi]|uniref:creatininase family protein n=1 Tax=Flavihumibacter profundi TaxID=2716883 RepID=UPI001CC623B4|nr:creatininase family protein [Flavihumibacter profundi]MBZ5856867.1 creatininase family protein [Flavihumibacter profundi]